MPEIKLSYGDEFEEIITDSSKIETLLELIEEFKIDVPELEVTKCSNGRESVTRFITLFRNSYEGGIAGWLAWRELKKKRDREYFCIKENEIAAFYVPVAYYGCPHEVTSSAIFSKADIVQFVGSLFKGRSDPRFVRRQMAEVYRRDDSSA